MDNQKQNTRGEQLMIRTFIFWLIVAPASLAFLLGLTANTAQKMADKITDEEVQEPQ